MTAEILIVDDEPDICELVSGILQDEGYATRTARDGDDALTAIKTRRPNLLFLDIWLQGSKLDGLQLLDAAKEQYPDLPVVMMTAYQTVDSAVESMRLGACDYLIKPLDNSRNKEVVRHALLVGETPSSMNADITISPAELVGGGDQHDHRQLAEGAPRTVHDRRIRWEADIHDHGTLQLRSL